MPAAESTAPFVSGVILAAGAATRMGRPKQLMTLGGRSILQLVLDAALASKLADVVVVLGAHASEIRAKLEAPENRRLRIVVNEAFEDGLSSSLRCGLGACDARADAAAVLLADQPGVGAPLIDRVLDAFAARRAPLTRPVFVTPRDEGTPGHPVILARSVWQEVEALSGDQGARALFARGRARVGEVRIEGEPPMDIDTVEDYRCASEHDGARTSV